MVVGMDPAGAREGHRGGSVDGIRVTFALMRDVMGKKVTKSLIIRGVT